MTPSPQWARRIVLIHWLTLAVVVCAFACVLTREFVEAKALRQSLLAVHRLAGLSALLLVLLRIPARFTVAQPDHGLPPLTRKLAAMGHGLLYVVLIATPVMGYALACARAGHVDVFGITLPALIEKDRDLADQIEGIHGALGWAMLGLVALHAAAALWHHHVKRDNVLRAMTRTVGAPR